MMTLASHLEIGSYHAVINDISVDYFWTPPMPSLLLKAFTSNSDAIPETVLGTASPHPSPGPARWGPSGWEGRTPLCKRSLILPGKVHFPLLALSISRRGHQESSQHPAHNSFSASPDEATGILLSILPMTVSLHLTV